jgi:hypothetical protein
MDSYAQRKHSVLMADVIAQCIDNSVSFNGLAGENFYGHFENSCICAR